MVTSVETTWQIRLPTATPREQAGAPAYTLSRPIAGLRVGLRHEGSWRSWMLIVEQWQAFLPNQLILASALYPAHPPSVET